MIEPKWTPIDEVEDWSLGWFFRDLNAPLNYEVNTGRYVRELGISHVWGPFKIPDQPKPLPKLRRFEATYNGERYSGVYCQDWPNPFRLFKLDGCVIFPPKNLDDITWIDS